MLNRIFFVCLFLALCGAASSLSCRWMDHRFRKFSKDSLDLIDTMVNNSPNTSENPAVNDTVTFPSDLYKEAFNASAEDKLGFTVQVLEEVVALFMEDHSSTSWQDSTVENFLITVSRQAEGLRSCIGSHIHKKKNKKLHMYFKRLSHHVLKHMGHSAEAWELIRKETTTHLLRTDLLVSTLLTTN